MMKTLPRFITVSIFFVFLFSMSTVVSVFLNSNDQVAYARIKPTCVTNQCHATMGKDKFVHGPVAVGDCKICHVPLKRSIGKKHTMKDFNQTIKGPKQCKSCHNSENDVIKGICKTKGRSCISCHNPHQSAYLFQLKNEPRKYKK